MIVQKKCYTIKLEVMAPVELTYKVWAEDPEEAAKMIGAVLTRPPKPNLSRKKNIKATIYDYGMSTIRFIKRFV